MIQMWLGGKQKRIWIREGKKTDDFGIYLLVNQGPLDMASR